MALNTKQRLESSLLKLLGKKQLDKITVKELVADCGINRQTFYYNFQDIYDLAEWTLLSATDRIAAQKADFPDWQQRLRAVFNLFLQNKVVLLNAYRAMERPRLEKLCWRILRPHLAELIDNRSAGMEIAPEDRDFLINAYLLVLISLLLEWLDNGLTDEYRDQTDRFFRFLDGGLEHTISKFAK